MLLIAINIYPSWVDGGYRTVLRFIPLRALLKQDISKSRYLVNGITAVDFHLGTKPQAGMPVASFGRYSSLSIYSLAFMLKLLQGR